MSDFISFYSKPRTSIEKSYYGVCEDCSSPLEPVWFKEEEIKVEHGLMYSTGIYRRAVDYLVCPLCLKHFCVDDTYDGPWIMER